MSKNDFFVKDLTLTELTKFLNADSRFRKLNGTEFSISDVQSYVNRGCLPSYMGKNKIVLVNKIKGVKLYNILK